MKTLFLALLLVLSSHAFAQISTISLGLGGRLSKIEKVSSGGYITTGFDSLQEQRCSRWDGSFHLLWSFKLPNTGFIPHVNNVIEANDGNFYYSVYSTVNNGSMTVFKLSSTGTLLWQKTYTGASLTFSLYAPTIAPALGNDNGFIFGTGSCSLSNSIIKCDSNGNIVWQKSYSFPLATGVITCSSILNDGSQYVVSSSYNVKSLLTFKLDSLGNVLSHSAYKYNEPAQIFPIRIVKLNESGGYAIVCQCNNSNNQIQYVVFLNSNLGVTSFNELTVPYQQFTLNDIAPVEKGNVVVNGSIFDSSRFRACAIKVGQQGNVIWSKLGKTMNESAQTFSALDFTGIVASNNQTTLHVGKGSTEGYVVVTLDTAGNGLCYETHFELTNLHRNPIQEFGNVSVFGSTAVANTANYLCANDNPYSTSLFCGTLPNAVQSISSGENSFKIYPNPSYDLLHFEFHENSTNLNLIDIISLDGKQVYHAKAGQSHSISTSLWTPGIYIVIVRNQTGKYYSKIQIQH